MSRAKVAAYIACALIWGTTWFAIRVCIDPGGWSESTPLHLRPGAFPTLVALALRFVIATILLVPFAVRARPWPTGRTWIYLVVAGVLDAAAYLLVYLGEERVPGGVAAVVYGTQPLILAIILRVVRIESLTRDHLIGAVISLAGVAVLYLDRRSVSTNQAIGVVLVFGSVIVATTYSVIMKRHGGKVHGVVSTTIFLAVTAIVLGIVALIAAEPMPWPPPVKPTLALAYLAVFGSVVAFLLYFWLLDRTSLQVTSTLVFLFPLVALATDAFYEHAIPLGPRAYLGSAITLGGLAVSLRRR